MKPVSIACACSSYLLTFGVLLMIVAKAWLGISRLPDYAWMVGIIAAAAVLGAAGFALAIVHVVRDRPVARDASILLAINLPAVMLMAGGMLCAILT